MQIKCAAGDCECAGRQKLVGRGDLQSSRADVCAATEGVRRTEDHFARTGLVERARSTDRGARRIRLPGVDLKCARGIAECDSPRRGEARGDFQRCCV